MKLKTDEAAAINSHMGATPGGDAIRDSIKAFEAYPLAWVVHVVDEAASYFYENFGRADRPFLIEKFGCL